MIFFPCWELVVKSGHTFSVHGNKESFPKSGTWEAIKASFQGKNISWKIRLGGWLSSRVNRHPSLDSCDIFKTFLSFAMTNQYIPKRGNNEHANSRELESCLHYNVLSQEKPMMQVIKLLSCFWYKFSWFWHHKPLHLKETARRFSCSVLYYVAPKLFMLLQSKGHWIILTW